MAAKQPRFLAITFRVGSPTDGFLVGPILVSTSDYRRFRYWDEPDEVQLEPGDYEIVKIYPQGLGREVAEVLFRLDFAPPESLEGYSWLVAAEGLGARQQSGCVVAA
jgi:hypothetical protein